jgi:hypothetical protein
VAINWHWAFGSESPTVLASGPGFSFSTLASFAAVTGDAEYTYTYTGSPTRYSMAVATTQTMTLPAVAIPSSMKGWACAALKRHNNASLQVNNTVYLVLGVLGAGTGRYVAVRPGSDYKSLRLYVDNVLKETTSPYDWDSWHYVALKYDMSTATWSGQLYVDGVAATASYTDPSSAEVSGALQLQGMGNSLASEPWLIGQIICYDDTADAGEVPLFCTRYEGNADGTNVGTWTPSVGVDDYAVLESPIDSSTYTQNAAPAALDRVQTLTNNGGSNIATALGTTPTTIPSVINHTYSGGQALTAKALVGDGVSETSGANTVIGGAGVYYAYALANTKPSGGAWVGTDAPELVYEIVST